MKKSPYGKTVVLTEALTGVECWNFIDGSEHTLPKGSLLQLEYATESDSTVCMLVDETGESPGISLVVNDGGKQLGYRFIVKNKDLNRLANAGLPAKTYDIVGNIMAYETGTLDESETMTLFQRLKSGGMLSQLQGHYGRTAKRLGII
jgi:hypothetical protein